MAICGKIVIDSIRYMTKERPRKRKRPRAYAASEPIASESSVTEPATIVELRRAWRKNDASRAPLKLSSVGCFGMYWSGVEKSALSGVNAERSAHRNGNSA